LKRNKYKSKWTKVDGISFPSKWEAEYWRALQIMEKAGWIERLERQVRYPLIVNGERVGTSVIDFRFTELDEEGKAIRVRLQDTKGFIGKDTNTQLWKLKHSIVKATTGLPVEIILRKNFREVGYETDQPISPMDRRLCAQLVAMSGRSKSRR